VLAREHSRLIPDFGSPVLYYSAHDAVIGVDSRYVCQGRSPGCKVPCVSCSPFVIAFDSLKPLISSQPQGYSVFRSQLFKFGHNTVCSCMSTTSRLRVVWLLDSLSRIASSVLNEPDIIGIHLAYRQSILKIRQRSGFGNHGNRISPLTLILATFSRLYVRRNSCPAAHFERSESHFIWA
jgi:hypothetical protein